MVASDPPAWRVLQLPCGELEVVARGETVTGLSWQPEAGREAEASEGLSLVCEQLAAYFLDPDTAFECELAEAGTAFCRRVWQALAEIPPGQVCTYGDLARQLGTFPRAVAAACRANPYPIIIPCHRVVARTGLGGYCGKSAGAALAIKRWLLRHEGWHG